MIRRLTLLFLPLLTTAVVIAQTDTCPTLERAAVSEARVWCMETEDGEACYGNSLVSSDADAFQRAGDRVALDETSSITTSIDVETNRYGVSLLRTTAYTAESWTSQPITMVLLGDVTITNTAAELVHEVAAIAAPQGVNVRALPTAEGRVITPLFDGELVMLTGILADASWLRVLLPDGQTGWIVAQAVAETPAELAVVDAETFTLENIYEPFAAFELVTASGDARCEESWESGVLVQTSGDEAVELRVNDQAYLLNGTAYVQADEEGETTISVIAGEVLVGEEAISEGYEFSLPFTEEAQTYDFARFAYLPTEILPQYVYVGLDLTTIITPAPQEDRSPIADVLATDRCILTTGPGGANLRGGPGTEFSIRGVMALRETAYPIGRTTGSDGGIWWELAQNIWISGATTVTGGDCVAVPQSQRIPVPPPTATPEA